MNGNTRRVNRGRSYHVKQFQFELRFVFSFQPAGLDEVFFAGDSAQPLAIEKEPVHLQLGVSIQNLVKVLKCTRFSPPANHRTHARTHTRTHAHTHENTDIHRKKRTHAPTNSRTNARTHERTHARTHTHEDTDIHKHKGTYAQRHVWGTHTNWSNKMFSKGRESQSWILMIIALLC